MQQVCQQVYLLIEWTKQQLQKGIELHIEAHPVGSIDQYGDSADVILLGPQVRYELKNVKAKYPGKPVEIINMQDYGMMNGEAVYKKAKAMMGE